MKRIEARAIKPTISARMSVLRFVPVERACCWEKRRPQGAEQQRERGVSVP
jgi:hypothetical protein